MKKIASVGPDIPQELLTATGRFAGPLGWNINRAFQQAAQWLESKFPLWAFSIVEDWAAGRFDQIETVVFSRSDDSAQRLYYYICELKARGLIAGPQAILFDVARVGRASSEARCLASVRKLAEQLGVGDQAIEAEIALRQTMQPPPQDTAQPLSICLLAGTPPPLPRARAGSMIAGQKCCARSGIRRPAPWCCGMPRRMRPRCGMFPPSAAPSPKRASRHWY